jgi:UDP-N-acetylmuramoyl-tripeptide--D-alanyl-D-alanine ligase
VNALAQWLILPAILLFGWRRTLSYLRYYQQEEYNGQRFKAWLRDNRAYDTRGTVILVAGAVLTLILPFGAAKFAASLFAALALITLALGIEKDPRTSGKKKLVMTQRASKIAYLAFGLFAVCAVLATLVGCPTCHSTSWIGNVFSALRALLVGIIVVQLPPYLLLAANALLWPAEKALQDRFVNDAKRILKEVNPFVIGITGSYGKTGAKAALGEILDQTLGATFWPKKSINTVLGITRTIRETMRPHHRYAVMEMGAYNIGSIKRLCDFTPPRAALVTAVGIMHLERFGSPENVYVAKSELAQALPPDGILVCNGDSPNARRMAQEHAAATTLLYGFDREAGHLDCYASDITFDAQGTRCVIHWKGQSFPARTRLLGKPNLSNMLGAFTMACALGADPSYAVACLANIEPVDNRLVLDQSSQISFLRDAYNSNPTGFQAALEVLQSLPASRRILMTPGMVELGDQQFEHNKRLAKMAAGICDLVLVVGTVNRAAILAGLQDAGYPADKTIVVDTRDEGFSALESRATRGDIVLLENDLGDTLEGKVRF